MSEEELKRIAEEEQELKCLTDKFTGELKRKALIKKAAVVLCFAAIFGLAIFASIYMVTGYYAGSSYPIDQAYRAVQQAASTNSIPQALKNLYVAQSILEGYSGDPKWWYPTGESNFNTIKANLAATITSLEAMKDQPLADYATQQQLANIRDSLAQLNDRIDAASYWMFLTPLAVLTLILMFIGLVGGGFGTAWAVSSYKSFDGYKGEDEAREKASKELAARQRVAAKTP